MPLLHANSIQRHLQQFLNRWRQPDPLLRGVNPNAPVQVLGNVLVEPAHAGFLLFLHTHQYNANPAGRLRAGIAGLAAVAENGYNTKVKLDLWVDGACEMNGRASARMGIGIVARYGEASVEEKRREWGEAVEDGAHTNNRAELHAILAALRKLPAARRGATTVNVFSDSQVAVRVLTGQYAASANTDLVAAIQREAKGYRSVAYHWTRGHCGSAHNERANTLAQRAARTLQP